MNLAVLTVNPPFYYSIVLWLLPALGVILEMNSGSELDFLFARGDNDERCPPGETSFKQV